jgi:hypothetical protein
VRNPQTLVWWMNRVIFFSRRNFTQGQGRPPMADAMKTCPGVNNYGFSER